MKVAVLAITKNGVSQSARLLQKFPDMEVYAPRKLHTDAVELNWYDESTTIMLGRLFASYQGIICMFSLGAVVRLVAPHLKDKKTDPAVLVIDDAMTYVISVLSGHIGGANKLATDIAKQMGATPVITTAADVNRTIAVDMVGRDLGWRIQDDSTVTAVSAHMVNGEKIGIYQDAGERDWWPGTLPSNVRMYKDINDMAVSDCRAFLIITDGMVPHAILDRCVVYRPPSLVAGIGVHHNTTSESIVRGLEASLKKCGLSMMSVGKLASLKKPRRVSGLDEAAKELGATLHLVDRGTLANVDAPTPSDIVRRFEGTASVSEAAALYVSGGTLIIKKQKFPPDLTIAVARK